MDFAPAAASIVIAPFVGSFLAVVVLRRDGGFVFGRSRCDGCRRALTPVELIPLLSYVLRRGRCRYCGARIDPLHPVLEAGALAVAVWAALVTPGWVIVVSCLLGWTLLTLAAIDWRTGLLPDALTLPLALTGLAVAWLVDRDALLGHAFGAVAGFAGFWALSEIYRRLRGRDGLGLGDAKLLAASGAWLGWEALPSVILFAAIVGLALVLVQGFRGKPVEAASRIAFGPTLAAATWIVWLYGPLAPA